MPDTAPSFVHYIPIATTVLSAVFFAVMARHYLLRNRAWHIFWWAFGILSYGAGTALESTITLHGNTVALTKAWYIVGALLGGYPLAQGSAYLHVRNRAIAHVLTVITVALIVVASIAVVRCPVHLDQLQAHRPSGKVLDCMWVRAVVAPLINTYAMVFLIGGAIYSAWRYFRAQTNANRVTGNVLIAAGAILPGIGGSFAAAGVVEALYIGEFIGIILIWIGYRCCVRPVERADAPPVATVTAGPISPAAAGR